MIKSLMKLILKVVGAILIVGILIWGLSCTRWGAVSDFARDVRHSVVEFFDPSQKVKDLAQKFLEGESEKIAQELGIEESEVDTILRKLDIDGLERIDLPDNALEKKTFTKTIMDVEVTITTYRDPGYVTISYEDETATVAIPEDAQKLILVLSNL